MLNLARGNSKCQKIVACVPQLRRYALALCGNRDEADELVQASVERGLRKIKLWRPDSDMRAWLFTIMHNIFVNQRRKQNRERAVFSDEGEHFDPAYKPNFNQGIAMQEIEKNLPNCQPINAK